MTARAIYKATLELGELTVPVKFFAAIEERSVRFRLLHEADSEPVVQELIDKSTEQPVARDEVRKAYQLDAQRLVKLKAEELDAIKPESSRKVTIVGFVPPSSIDFALYDRPYYLGPDGDDEAYFALVRALEQHPGEGLAEWVMRDRQYLGALRTYQGSLVLNTLRRADDIIDVSSIVRSESKELSPQELKLASQLIEALEGDFELSEYQDDYRERVAALAEQKASGKVIALKRPSAAPKKLALEDALKDSLKGLKKRKSA